MHGADHYIIQGLSETVINAFVDGPMDGGEELLLMEVHGDLAEPTGAHHLHQAGLCNWLRNRSGMDPEVEWVTI